MQLASIEKLSVDGLDSSLGAPPKPNLKQGKNVKCSRSRSTVPLTNHYRNWTRRRRHKSGRVFYGGVFEGCADD